MTYQTGEERYLKIFNLFNTCRRYKKKKRSLYESTFEGRLEHRGRFGRQQDAAGVLVEGAALLVGHDELPDEAGSVSDVVALVVFAEVQDVLGQQLRLGGEKRKAGRGGRQWKRIKGKRKGRLFSRAERNLIKEEYHPHFRYRTTTSLHYKIHGHTFYDAHVHNAL